MCACTPVHSAGYDLKKKGVYSESTRSKRSIRAITSSYFSAGIWSYRLPIPMSTSKADFWSVEGWISASRRETLTYLAPKSFNTNSGVQLSTETKSARSRVACESSLLLHWIDAIVRPEYSSSRCCVIKSPIQWQAIVWICCIDAGVWE